MKKCPYCSEEIQDEAKKCRFCGEFIEEEKVNEDNVNQNEKVTNSKYSRLIGILVFIISFSLTKYFGILFFLIVFIPSILGLYTSNILYKKDIIKS